MAQNVSLSLSKDKTPVLGNNEAKVIHFEDLTDRFAKYTQQHLTIFPNDEVEWSACVESAWGTKESGPHFHCIFVETNQVQQGIDQNLGEFHWKANQNGVLKMRKKISGSFKYTILPPKCYYVIPYPRG